MTNPQSAKKRRTTPPSSTTGVVIAAPPVTESLTVHAQALQATLTDISTVTVGQVAALFSRYGGEPDFPVIVRQLVPEIVRPNMQSAATVTAQWYEDLNPASTYKAEPVADIVEERIQKTVDWSLYAPGDAEPVERLSGSAKRMIFDASRQTVTANACAENVKWVRYAQPDACAFCRVLATRPPVYLSKQSAETVVGRGVIPTARGKRKIGEKYHDHCRCIGIPIRESYTWLPPKYVQQWQKDYEQARADITESRSEAMSLSNILAKIRSNTGAK